MEAVRWNERWKAFASFGDNSALALFAAGIAKAFSDGPDEWFFAGVAFGIVFLWMAWHIRGLIQSED